MANLNKGTINVYDSDVLAASSLKAYIYKGKYIYNFNTQDWVSAPDVTVGAAHEITLTAIPNVTNTIGYEVDLSDMPIGRADLVFLDGTSYVYGLKVHKSANNEITAIAE